MNISRVSIESPGDTMDQAKLQREQAVADAFATLEQRIPVLFQTLIDALRDYAKTASEAYGKHGSRGDNDLHGSIARCYEYSAQEHLEAPCSAIREEAIAREAVIASVFMALDESIPLLFPMAAPADKSNNPGKLGIKQNSPIVAAAPGGAQKVKQDSEAPLREDAVTGLSPTGNSVY
jgi:hypothetical protein